MAQWRASVWFLTEVQCKKVLLSLEFSICTYDIISPKPRFRQCLLRLLLVTLYYMSSVKSWLDSVADCMRAHRYSLEDPAIKENRYILRNQVKFRIVKETETK